MYYINMNILYLCDITVLCEYIVFMWMYCYDVNVLLWCEYFYRLLSRALIHSFDPYYISVIFSFLYFDLFSLFTPFSYALVVSSNSLCHICEYCLFILQLLSLKYHKSCLWMTFMEILQIGKHHKLSFRWWCYSLFF